MQAKFIQYLMPDGRKKDIYIDVIDEVGLKAQAIWEAGYRLEIEMLSTGHISMTIVGMDHEIGEEQDLAQKVCANGPAVVDNVCALISEFIIPPTLEIPNGESEKSLTR